MLGTMRTPVLPVRANGKSIHARTMSTSVSPVRANGELAEALKKECFRPPSCRPKPRPQRILVNCSFNFRSAALSPSLTLKAPKYCHCHVICLCRLQSGLLGARLRTVGTLRAPYSTDPCDLLREHVSARVHVLLETLKKPQTLNPESKP